MEINIVKTEEKKQKIQSGSVLVIKNTFQGVKTFYLALNTLGLEGASYEAINMKDGRTESTSKIGFEELVNRLVLAYGKDYEIFSPDEIFLTLDKNNKE